MLAPIKLDNSDMHVLVNRGWVATGNDRSQLPQILTKVSEVNVEGIVESPAIKALELSDQVIIALWIVFGFEPDYHCT